MTSNNQALDIYVELFRAQGYVLRPSEHLALRGLLTHQGSGAAAALLSGPPGVGKTALGETLARVQSCALHRAGVARQNGARSRRRARHHRCSQNNPKLN